MPDRHCQGQISQTCVVINNEVQIMGVLSVDGRHWEGGGNGGAGGGHAFHCY